MTLRDRNRCEPGEPALPAPARRGSLSKGPAAPNCQPSPEGLGIGPEDDVSAVGAALNLRSKQRPSPHLHRPTTLRDDKGEGGDFIRSCRIGWAGEKQGRIHPTSAKWDEVLSSPPGQAG
jgi:hypothetical protein